MFQKKYSILIFSILIVLFLILAILFSRSKRDAKATELIKEKLKQAQDVSDLNLSRSIILLNEAKKDFSELRKKLGVNSSAIKEVEELIKKYDKKILKSEEKKFSEFYDISLEKKNVKIKEISKFDDSIVTFDNSQNTYVISLSQKSIDTRKSSLLKNVISITKSEEVIYFLKDDGVYSLTENEKTKKIIKNENWKKAKSLIYFSGNIYLLDPDNSDIYKYTPTETGFSEETSYFAKGQTINLNGANSFAIDGSIYIAFDESIFKFTSGLRDGFSTEYPTEKLNLTKIFTDKDTDFIYAWSKIDGIIYIISKQGNYENQIKSSILKTATDFTVFENAIYPVKDAKIYKIDLN